MFRMITIKYLEKILYTSCYTKTKIYLICYTICIKFCMVGYVYFKEWRINIILFDICAMW